MKKLSIIAAAIIAGSLSASALAFDGQIQFRGKITGESCTVTNNPTNPLVVTLGEVAVSAFGGAKGAYSSISPFKISLTSCPASAKTAKVKFESATHPDDVTLLAPDAVAGVATGVGVLIADANNGIVRPLTASAAYTLATGTNDLEFTARYKSTSATVTAGPADISTSFTLIYN